MPSTISPSGGSGGSSAGASGAIQKSNGSGGFSDSGLSVATVPSSTSGVYLKLPAITALNGGDLGLAFGSFVSISGDTAHEWIGGYAAQVYSSAAGTTAFVGNDGSNPCILGNPAGAIGINAHMTALGSSVDAESAECVCIGHQAIAKSVGNSIIIGAGAQDISLTGAGNISIGGKITGSGATYDVIIGTSTISSTSGFNILIGQTGNVGGSIGLAIGIGYQALPTASNHVVIGGSLATDFYAGTESTFATGHFKTIIHQTGPRTITTATGVNVGDNSVIYNIPGGATAYLGDVAITGYRLRVKTITNDALTAQFSNVVPLAGGSPGNAILPATAGKWADLEFDGTNWVITGSGDETSSGSLTIATTTNVLKGNGSGGAVASAMTIDGSGSVNLGASSNNSITGASIQLGTNSDSYIVSVQSSGLMADAARGYGFSPSTSYNQSPDTQIKRNAAGVVEVNNGTAISGTSNAGSIKALTFIPVGTATTCTGATIGTGSKSNAGFVTSTTTGTTTCVITFPVTAPTGWNIVVQNGTTPADVLTQTASSTTTATFVGTTLSGDVIRYIAMPY
jgi:hypothetical protein